MRVVVDYLVQRNGWFHFRRAVPPHLREAIGKREWKQALRLRVGQEVQAAGAVRQLTEETATIIAEAERLEGSGFGAAARAYPSGNRHFPFQGTSPSQLMSFKGFPGLRTPS